MNAQNLQSSVECARQLELFVEDRDHQIGADCNPYLSLHRIGTGPVVVLDAQVALDPAEEQFDAPAHLVKHGDGVSRDLEIVGQEDERFACFRIEVFHPPEGHWKGIAGLFECWLAYMIAAQAGQTIHQHRVMPGELKVGLGTGDKERSRLGDQRQSDEVHIASIHQIKGSRLEEQAVEPAHVVLARIGNVDTSRNRATQVDLGVHLDARLGLPEVSGRWWWNPVRRSCCPDPDRDPRQHRAALPCASGSWQVPPKSASRGSRWRPRESIWQPVRQTRDDRVFRVWS
jgi:hypothetical protein